MPRPEFIRCLQCGVEKHNAEFYRNKFRCKPCYSEREKARYHVPQTRQKNIRRMRARQYGLTPEEIDQMAKEQHHKCKICGEFPEKGLFVDHCHSTDLVRGLLCHYCNILLGAGRDRIEILKSAIEYLKMYRQ